ncbi:uncharacterized protein TEOVI_000339500 [Trypanosoma equiperdum]|uniref:Uncharacterized protein n=1 Tax=Trypanosoma equiperdum TaxID=5694 RepID=A0A1G4IH93_TRYEQ|nr:hypothetical protein, conserved [Trypanosoma equiperdum]
MGCERKSLSCSYFKCVMSRLCAKFTSSTLRRGVTTTIQHAPTGLVAHIKFTQMCVTTLSALCSLSLFFFLSLNHFLLGFFLYFPAFALSFAPPSLPLLPLLLFCLISNPRHLRYVREGLFLFSVLLFCFFFLCIHTGAPSCTAAKLSCL